MDRLTSSLERSMAGRLGPAIRCALVVLCINACGRLGQATAYTPEKISLLWLPPGIAIAVFYRWGSAFVPVVYLAILLIQLRVSPSFGFAAVISVSSTFGPWVAARILKATTFDPNFGTWRDVLQFVLLSTYVMLIPATGGTSCLWLAAVIPTDEVPKTWLIWWLGDSVGVMSAAPFLLGLNPDTFTKLIRNRSEVVFYLFIFSLLSWLVFFDSARDGWPNTLYVLIVWATMRFGILGGSLSILAAALVAALATKNGLGPFHAGSNGLVALWIYVCTLSVVNLMITALQATGLRANAALKRNLDQTQKMAADLAAAKEAAENSFRETKALWATIDRNSIVSITDIDSKITEVNNLFCEISGYSREEVLGRDHSVVSSGSHTSEFWSEMWEALKTKQSWRNRVCNRAKDGSAYWIDLTVAPFMGGDGKIVKYVSIGNDITQRVQGEMHLVEARLAADSANRAKSEFLAHMSHEIRTPLTSIIGSIEMLCDYSDVAADPARRTQSLEQIRTAAHHLLTIINDILDLSKIEADKMEVEVVETPIFKALSEVESMVRPRAEEKGLKLITRLDTPVPDLLMTDPTRLRQILLNVLGNAAKFTKQGSVTTSLKVVDRDFSRFLALEFEDTGPGLAEDQVDQLFKKFQQADPSITREHGGTGLGLTISRRLARLMGGDLTLNWTEPGTGSRFRLELPLVTPPDATYITFLEQPKRDSVSVEVPSEPSILRGRILLTEDSPVIRKVIAFHLTKAGAKVDVAENGQAALDLIDLAAAKGEAYDLLITDMQMPVLDGYALARTIKSSGSTMPIIALTAHSLSEERQHCIDSGCDDYLSKPVERAALIEMCRHHLASKYLERVKPHSKVL